MESIENRRKHAKTSTLAHFSGFTSTLLRVWYAISNRYCTHIQGGYDGSKSPLNDFHILDLGSLHVISN